MLFRKKAHICLYTAIYGPREQGVSQRWLELGFPVICFSDRNDLNLGDVKLINGSSIATDPNRSAKFYKMNPQFVLPDYQYTIWFDACLHPNYFDVEALVDSVLGSSEIALFAHPERSCLYQEATVCIEHKRDSVERITTQINRYRALNFPESYGLYAGGFLVRPQHNPRSQALNELWWREIVHGSRRDQLSFPYVARELAIKPIVIPGSIWENELFTCAPHAGEELSG